MDVSRTLSPLSSANASPSRRAAAPAAGAAGLPERPEPQAAPSPPCGAAVRCRHPLPPRPAPTPPAARRASAPLPVWRAHVPALIEPDAIHQRVAALGARITADYADQQDAGLVVIGVLRGAFVFHADLVRHIELPLECDFVRLASYGDAQHSSGQVRMPLPPSTKLAGKHVLVVEDIVDTGLSMQFLLSHLREQKAASVELCTLLRKPSRHQVSVHAKYVGFEVPDQFVVGYGLDAAGRFRNVPYVGVLKP